MKPTAKKPKTLVLILYIIFLFWMIVLNGQFSLKQTYLLARMNPTDPLSNGWPIFDSIANILFFFPLGYIIRWIDFKTNRYVEVAVLALLCLLLAIVRYTLRTGHFDTMDIISGVVGGLIGLYVCRLNHEDNTVNTDLENQGR